MAIDDNDKMGIGDIPDELTDEVAAAVAELKAAQEKLDALKAKISQEQADSPAAPEAAPASAQPPAPAESEAKPGQEQAASPAAPDAVPASAQAPTPPPDPYVQQPYYPQNTVPPQTPQPQPQYYYQQQQYPPQMVATKDHVAAGLLGIFLGWLGIHKFYLGYNTAGFIMLAVTILGSVLTLGIAAAVVGIIGFIEGILYLVKSQSEFEQIYVFNKREWF